jgi:Domain of unknown function (DUF4410)
MKLFALLLMGTFAATVGAAAIAAQEEIKSANARQTTAPSSPEVSSPAAQQSSQPSVATPSVDKSKIVYVSDFELDALDENGKVEKSVPATIPAIAPAPAPQSDPNSPESQASRLVDFMSAMLVKELEKAGYTAHRLRPADDRPTDGIRISGIFTEPDEQNRIRRAVMGTITVAGKMLIFVGIGNLAKPDQALYAVATPNSSENKTETVITVSAYAPVAKFEIDKNVTEKDVKDTAFGIVANLSALLSANVVALTQ